MNTCVTLAVVLSLLVIVAAVELEDPCALPAVTGVCDAAYLRYYYDTTSSSCEPFFYGGCGGNANNFLTQQACHERCGCEYKGLFHAAGQTFKDDCNSCLCSGNNYVACSRRDCTTTH